MFSALLGALTTGVSAIGSNLGPLTSIVSSAGRIRSMFGFGGDAASDAEHNERELAFRRDYGFAAPTGRARDVEIPRRNRWIKRKLGRTGLRNLRRVCGGGPAQCMGVGPVRVPGVPNAQGWPEFSLGPSKWQQLVSSSGGSDVALWNRLRGSSVGSVARPSNRGSVQLTRAPSRASVTPSQLRSLLLLALMQSGALTSPRPPSPNPNAGPFSKNAPAGSIYI